MDAEERKKILEARKAMRLPGAQPFVKMWHKEHDPAALVVLTDWLYEQGIDAAPVIEQVKLFSEQGTRRMLMEEVTHEQGNLESEPWLIQPLTMEAPRAPEVQVELKERVNNELFEYQYRVVVPADHPARILDRRWRRPGDPSAPKGSYLHSPTWKHFTLSNSHKPWGATELDPEAPPIDLHDDNDIIRRADALAEENHPYVGMEGELFYKRGEPYETWLYMEYAPEYLQSELEREYGYDMQFITRYTDGGGFQSNAEEAFVDVATGSLYQLVRDGAHSAEVECPLKDYDQWNRGARGGDVTDEDTLFGENPHKECRFCGAAIGEEHGHVYVGEGAELVYILVAEADEAHEDPSRSEPRFPQGTLFVAAEGPITGEAYTIDLQSTHVPDEDGNYVNPREWLDASEDDWGLAEVAEADFGEELGTLKIDGRLLRVYTWEV